MDLTPQTEFSEQRPNVNFPTDYDPSLKGIGGWLIVIIIGMILSVILGIIDISDSISILGLNTQFDALLIANIAVDTIFCVLLPLVIIYLMYRLNILFRILFVIQVSVTFVFYIFFLISFYDLGIELDSTSLFRSIVSGIIWIAYVYKSKRVKNTFIYPRIYNI